MAYFVWRVCVGLSADADPAREISQPEADWPRRHGRGLLRDRRHVLARPVAVKVLSPSVTPSTTRSASASPARRSPRRACRESPNIVTIYDVDEFERAAVHRHGVRPVRLAPDERAPARVPQPPKRVLPGSSRRRTRSTARTRAASFTATSSPRTSCSTREASFTSPTSASRARLGSRLSPRPAPCSAPPATSRRSRPRVQTVEASSSRPVRARHRRVRAPDRRPPVSDRLRHGRSDGSRVSAPVPRDLGARARDPAGGRRRVPAGAREGSVATAFSSCAEFVVALRRRVFDAAAGTTHVGGLHARELPSEARDRSGSRASRSARARARRRVPSRQPSSPRGPAARVAEHAPSPSRSRGTTLRETVTAQPPRDSSPSPPTALLSLTSDTSVERSGVSAPRWRSTAIARLQAGDAAGALPLLSRRPRSSRGHIPVSEAYNDYNLALALTQTQGCSTQVVQLLDASAAIQGHRSEIEHLRQACTRGG